MSDAYVDRTLRKLRLRWVAVATIATVATALSFGGLRLLLADDLARRWLLLTVPVLAYELALLWYVLPRNREEGRLLASFGPGTQLTLARGVLIAFLAGFLLLSRPTESLVWLPALLYGAAALADYVDGTLARLTDHVTTLGARLDTEFDALGILIAPLLAVLYGQLPVWYLSVSAARYLFVFGRWLRRRRDRPVFALPPRASRRYLAGLQMAFLTLVLSPVVTPPVTTVGAVFVAVPFIVGFVRDWLYVSGRLSEPTQEQ
ncbi:CDP-alcohol phosphatidyltransferase family protein [Halalkalicoccus jeotgali]|uniref:CDP-diacylglycerol--glycerol-3-phosphate 3-phosphatidyl-transferase n=1 Tax=Halalkalicoccus jeotgali (strain DSM 18796 / CECT 7217 / JCM 14584 / KCTC 4019 / B3) TaxID=795797 RepID=D8J9T7_HALJB|nr:CDP-alcohol phosphatidyltransferase family protein [Halalkalicoccus jeotgali]ADJ16426.1 CDP-diacylglycerol--glycerol-3-phosphate 3-phosphatidyl-transferase [Halalkalicoccus jeotgali B3]ELY37160.1 CDP-diacylglycerol--glycerol-3-phosphate 3-phosphatidyl-transferase [Halalkalicoccus jeotgali B3]